MRAEDEKTLAALVLALGVVAALAFPELSSALAPYLLHTLFFVMVFSLLPFARHSLPDLIRPHRAVFALVAWQQFALPAAILAVGLAIGIDRQWLFFLLLTVTSGSLFASPTLVQLMGLNQKIAVQTVILSTLAAPISIYLSFRLLLGSELDLALDQFALRLFGFLVVPIAIFCAVKVLIARWTEAAKDRLSGFGRWGAVLALVAFCFALENEVNIAIQQDPHKVLVFLWIAIGSAALVGAATRIVMRRFGPQAALTGTLLTSFRNVGLTFGLVGQVGGPELALYVGVAQIPMFLSPLLLDVFLCARRTPPDGLATDETTPAPGSASMLPVGGAPAGGYRLAAAGGPEATAYGLAPARQYYAPDAVALAVSPMAQPETTQAATAPAEAELVTLPPGREIARESAHEDARALIGRVASALQDEMPAGSQAGAENLRAARYIALFCLAGLAGLAAVWQANRYFFPMLYDNELIEEVAAAHVAGRNFAVFDLNINIRDLRDATIARLERTPEVVVLGASHWQEAHVDLLANRDFYNSHVHRDYYEDMLAVTEMWVRHDKLPGEMIITIRDNLLTPVAERTDFLWYPGIKYYRAFAERIGLEPHSRWATLPFNTWRELLSLPLLWSQAERQLTAPVQPHATDRRAFETLDILLPGGSILWSGEHQRMFTQERARNEALAFAKARRNDPPKIDPKGVAHLEALFAFLKRQGVKVTLAHPQFNPLFWEAVQGSPYMDGLKKVEDLTQHWSRKYGFPVIGGFSPESVGCTADMYIDAEHGNPQCLGMLLRQYPQQQPAARRVNG